MSTYSYDSVSLTTISQSSLLKCYQSQYSETITIVP